MKRLKILTPSFYALYSHNYSFSTKIFYRKINEIELDLNNNNILSALNSFMIEGEIIDTNKFLEYKSQAQKTTQKSFLIADDIIKTYEFAQKNQLTAENILKAHKICSKNLLPAKERGIFRTDNLILKSHKSKNIYAPPTADAIPSYFSGYTNDISLLLKRDLRLNMAFYYAAYLHIAFLHISPFAGLNGIMARIIEKWFLSHKLDRKSWFIASEEFYYLNRRNYFENISKIGGDFEHRNYEIKQDFVLMLPNSLEIQAARINPLSE
ncbi:MAG: Fic family protein [Bacteroidales bacterium]|nr:Fic family protein [Bacteroidales bacterium]